MKPPLVYGIQQIGFGPAGLGIIAVADREGRLTDLNKIGLAIHEKKINNSWNNFHLDLDIESNTPANFFISHFNRSGIFKPAFGTDLFNNLESHGASNCLLSSANKFLSEIALLSEGYINSINNSDIFFNSHIKQIVLDDNGLYHTTNEMGVKCTSKTLLFCTGSLEANLSAYGNYINSSDILRGKIDEYIFEKLTNIGSITIIGASHSAFSCALRVLYLKKQYQISAKVNIIARKKPKIYFENIESAINSNYILDAEDQILPNGTINESAGLRGKAAKLALDVMTGLEQNLTIIAPNIPYCINDSLVVNATGYQPHPVNLIRENGEKIRLNRLNDCYVIDQNYRILDENGLPIVGLFGLGIGFYRSDEFKKFSSVDDFLGHGAKTIFDQLLKD